MKKRPDLNRDVFSFSYRLHQESNPDQRLRRALLCPLSYGGKRIVSYFLTPVTAANPDNRSNSLDLSFKIFITSSRSFSANI